MALSKKQEESFFAEERRDRILQIVNASDKTTVAELCETFSVSPATIRNDLRDLEESGLLKRTHGGAISNKRINFEHNAYQKEVENIAAKRAIAQIAVAYVNEGDTIAIDTGTTTFEFAKLLTEFQNLNVVTNDLQIAAFLEQNSAVKIIFAGGEIRRNFHCTIGQKAIEAIADLSVDRVFMAANGVSVKRGITTPDIDTANVKERIARMGDEVILLADSTKLDRVSFVRFADTEQMDVLITDDAADADFLEKVRGVGVLVELCKAGK